MHRGRCLETEIAMTAQKRHSMYLDPTSDQLLEVIQRLYQYSNIETLFICIHM